MNAPLGDAAQQLPVLATPPAPAHWSAVVTAHVRMLQSSSTAQMISGSLLHAVFTHVPVAVTTQATAARLPHVDCAAHGTVPRTQRRLRPAVRS